MLCQKCGANEANVHIVQIINGRKAEQHLCSQCAGMQEPTLFDTTYNMNKLISNFFQQTIEEEQHCENCGMSFNDFTKIGFFGCPHCYSVFEQRLEEPLKRLQGATTHRGKRLQNVEKGQPKEKDLQEQLSQAIAEEKYELAAELRDQIKEREGK